MRVVESMCLKSQYIWLLIMDKISRDKVLVFLGSRNNCYIVKILVDLVQFSVWEGGDFIIRKVI